MLKELENNQIQYKSMLVENKEYKSKFFFIFLFTSLLLKNTFFKLKEFYSFKMIWMNSSK